MLSVSISKTFPSFPYPIVVVLYRWEKGLSATCFGSAPRGRCFGARSTQRPTPLSTPVNVLRVMNIFLVLCFCGIKFRVTPTCWGEEKNQPVACGALVKPFPRYTRAETLFLFATNCHLLFQFSVTMLKS